jgi:mono/diheme cytochrome c family protein
MTIYLLKSIIAVFFLALALAAALSMLTVMGRAEKKTSPDTLRKIHRVTGYIFALFLLGLSTLGIRIVVQSGDSLPVRAVIHGFIGLFLLAIFLLKLLIARFYRQLLRLMPALGMTVFVMSMVMFSMAGYYFLRAVASEPVPGEPSPPPAATPVDPRASSLSGDVDNGAALFASLCSSCHHADREENKVGPGFKGLFRMAALPYSRKPVTEGNIRQQLVRPALSMPSFARMSEQEIADLMAFLKTL